MLIHQSIGKYNYLQKYQQSIATKGHKPCRITPRIMLGLETKSTIEAPNILAQQNIIKVIPTILQQQHCNIPIPIKTPIAKKRL